MLISDQVRDLVKICFEGRRPCVPLKTARLHPGSWINRLFQQSLHVMIYVEKARAIERESLMWWYSALIKCGNIVSGWLWIVLSVPRTWLIVWFPEVVDRQISGMSWRSWILCTSMTTLCKCLVEVILNVFRRALNSFNWRALTIDYVLIAYNWLWYAINTSILIQSLRARIPEVKQVWLAVDSAGGGPTELLYNWYKLFCQEGKKCGYLVNGSKR